jgi:hypothetical protein
MAKDDLKVVSKTSDQEIITRELPYQLNAEELNNLGLEMANQVATQGELEESKASFMAGYKKDMDENVRPVETLRFTRQSMRKMGLNGCGFVNNVCRYSKITWRISNEHR